MDGIRNENLMDEIFSKDAGIKFHPVQDFYNGSMYYGVDIKGNHKVINSKFELIPISALNNLGLEPVITKLPEMSSRILGNEEFLKTRSEFNSDNLYDKIKWYLRTYLYLNEESYYDLLTLWCIGTYVFKMFPAFPYLHFQSEKGSGKTTALKLLEGICFNAQFTSSATKPIFYRLVNRKLPTLLLDEAEHFTKAKGTDNGILEVAKSGYEEMGTATLISEKDFDDVLTFTTYCPKAFAGIEGIDSVLSDRALKIPISRIPVDEHIDQYMSKERSTQRRQFEIRTQLYLLGLTYGSRLHQIYSNLEYEPWYALKNRHHQLWAPIFAIATLFDDLSVKEQHLNRDMMSLAKVDMEKKNHRNQQLDIYPGILQELFKIVNESDGNAYNAKPRGYHYQVETALMYNSLLSLDIIPKTWDKHKLSQFLSNKELATTRPSNGTRKYFIDIAKVNEQHQIYCPKVDDVFEGYP